MISMMYHPLLITLLFCGLSQGTDRYRKESWEYDDDLNLVGLQEDDKEDIYRPCDVRDLSCIREYFAKNSECSIAKGPAPDPLILERNTIYTPLVNVSFVMNNYQISGLNQAEIKDFYVNRNTGNVVFAFNIYGLSERCTYTSIRRKRTGKEPIVLTDFSTATYPEIRYTAVIPKLPYLQLHKADIHAFIASDPVFIVGPDVATSKDPDVIEAYATLLTSLRRILRESHVLKTSLYVTTFIQHNICDFGQKIVTV